MPRENGVYVRTKDYTEQDTPDEIYLTLDVATVDAAEAGIRQAVMDFVGRFLIKHQNLAFARDHQLFIQRTHGHGLDVIESCSNPPCPWFGQDRDATDIPSRTVFTAYWMDRPAHPEAHP